MPMQWTRTEAALDLNKLDELMTVRDAAREIGISENTLRGIIHRGNHDELLPVHRGVTGRVRLAHKDVQRFKVAYHFGEGAM